MESISIELARAATTNAPFEDRAVLRQRDPSAFRQSMLRMTVSGAIRFALGIAAETGMECGRIVEAESPAPIAMGPRDGDRGNAQNFFKLLQIVMQHSPTLKRLSHTNRPVL